MSLFPGCIFKNLCLGIHLDRLVSAESIRYCHCTITVAVPLLSTIDNEYSFLVVAMVMVAVLHKRCIKFYVVGDTCVQLGRHQKNLRNNVRYELVCHISYALSHSSTVSYSYQSCQRCLWSGSCIVKELLRVSVLHNYYMWFVSLELEPRYILKHGSVSVYLKERVDVCLLSTFRGS